MKRKKIIPNMNIEIPQEYRQSLVPYPKEMLEPMNLPEETFAFLTQVGLPRCASCEITPNVPLKFFEAPYVQPHAHLQNTFLYVDSYRCKEPGGFSNTGNRKRPLGAMGNE